MGNNAEIKFEAGKLSHEEIQAILEAVPIDISFVDSNNVVKYFNKLSKSRIFVRPKEAIGRRVQQCHPQKSLHAVNQIIEDFRNGKRDVAEFWINVKGRFVHIRYFAIRNASGKYLGCLEVTQDITEIKNLSGEKRLLE
ncbi:MAG: PAS domain-containing protein [Candidatus Micrarchaeia archaeon]